MADTFSREAIIGSATASSLQSLSETPNFVYLEERHKCPVCHNVLRDAVQTKCGHRLCQLCVDVLFAGSDKAKCPVMEEGCEDELTKQDINRDTSARREISLLPVCCVYQHCGCSEVTAWKNLNIHVQQCEFRLVDCTHSADGCTQKIALCKLQDHIKNDCLFRPIKCQYCDVHIPIVKLKEHQDKDCSKVLVKCLFKCGAKEMTREQFQQHKKNCPRKPKECRFRTIGCQFQGTEAEVIKHERETTDQHLQMITIYTANIDLQNLEIRRQLQDVANERDAMKNQIVEHDSEIKTLHQSVEQLKVVNKELKIKLVTLTERIIHLERKTDGMVKKDVVDRHTCKIQAIEQKQAYLQDQMSQGVGNSSGHGDYETMMQQLQQHDRELGIHDIRLAELDLRSQVMETSSYNGMLLWKIRDYSRRKQEAVTGKTLSLYSQPFYSTRFGYKMCARIYLNGDGMGKNTHMSLFFVIMRGEYDALLKWPFQQKVALILMDQDLGQRHLTDTFRPDATSTSFKKPTSEMNIASGCPLFVSHSILETSTYLKDDTMFIKIQVEVSNLFQP